LAACFWLLFGASMICPAPILETAAADEAAPPTLTDEQENVAASDATTREFVRVNETADPAVPTGEGAEPVRFERKVIDTQLQSNKH
jgi:hypothetical protein